jgi:hypothetical protein
MKNILIGIIVGAILFIPATAVAWSNKPIPFTNTIYNISDEVDTVSVFDDEDNKCYIVQGRATESVYKTPGYTYAISCVKR